MSSSSEQLLQRVEEYYGPLREGFARLGEAGLDRVTSAGWTAKELLAHVAFWNEAVEGVVRFMFRGEPISDGFEFGSGFRPYAGEGWPHFDVHNAREAAWAREHSPEEVMFRASRAEERLLAILATVTDAEAEANRTYFAEVSEHHREHLAELERGTAGAG